MKTVWVVGQFILTTDDGAVAWGIQGVFETEADAVGAAGDDPYMFVGPVEVGKMLPRESSDWPGCYYPATQAGE